MADQLRDVIRDRAALRKVIAEPSALVADKVIDHVDDHCRRFIGASPFLVLATTNAAGDVDLSPKGDPPGFVRVLDDGSLAIPDRPGNHRVDTLCNLVEDPRIGLIFLVPGKRETLRISGHARIVRDPWLLDALAHQGRAPLVAVVVAVRRAFFHCAKCMIRSGLWDPEAWPDTGDLPSLAETMVSHGRLSRPVEEVERVVRDDAATRLY